jgi:hypothetical protein
MPPSARGPFWQGCQLGNFRCPQTGSIHRLLTSPLPSQLHLSPSPIAEKAIRYFTALLRKKVLGFPHRRDP